MVAYIVYSHPFREAEHTEPEKLFKRKSDAKAYQKKENKKNGYFKVCLIEKMTVE